MRLGICSRSKDVIEPMIKPQWYVKCDDLAKAACDAVRSGELEIVPPVFKDVWFRCDETSIFTFSSLSAHPATFVAPSVPFELSDSFWFLSKYRTQVASST